MIQAFTHLMDPFGSLWYILWTFMVPGSCTRTLDEVLGSRDDDPDLTALNQKPQIKVQGLTKELNPNHPNITVSQTNSTKHALNIRFGVCGAG